MPDLLPMHMRYLPVPYDLWSPNNSNCFLGIRAGKSSCIASSISHSLRQWKKINYFKIFCTPHLAVFFIFCFFWLNFHADLLMFSTYEELSVLQLLYILDKLNFASIFSIATTIAQVQFLKLWGSESHCQYCFFRCLLEIIIFVRNLLLIFVRMGADLYSFSGLIIFSCKDFSVQNFQLLCKLILCMS